MDRKFFDAWGIITQYPDKDGGDASCEHNAYQAGLQWSGKEDTLGRSLGVMWRYSKSYFFKDYDYTRVRRHPDQSQWYSDLDRGTGDATLSLIIHAGNRNDNEVLFGMLWGFIKRFWFCTNSFRRNYWKDKDEHIKKAPSYKKWPDDLSYLHTTRDFRPLFVGQFIRSLRFWPFYPLLFVTDFLDLFVGACLMFSNSGKTKEGSDLNYILKTEQARRNLPTPISWAARELYKKRPVVHPELYLGPFPRGPKGPLSALQWHCKPPNPPLDEIFKPIIESW